MDIVSALDKLDLRNSSEYRPQYGHCREIGVALYDVYGGQLLALSQTPNWKQQDHVMLRVGGDVYDGTGRVLPATLLHQYVHEPENPLDDYLFEVSRDEVWNHRNFDEEVYNRVHRRLSALRD